MSNNEPPYRFYIPPEPPEERAQRERLWAMIDEQRRKVWEALLGAAFQISEEVARYRRLCYVCNVARVRETGLDPNDPEALLPFRLSARPTPVFETLPDSP